MIFIAAANSLFSCESVTNIPHPELTFEKTYHCQISPNQFTCKFLLVRAIMNHMNDPTYVLSESCVLGEPAK
jgi:hypothetical protein